MIRSIDFPEIFQGTHISTAILAKRNQVISDACIHDQSTHVPLFSHGIHMFLCSNTSLVKPGENFSGNIGKFFFFFRIDMAIIIMVLKEHIHPQV